MIWTSMTSTTRPSVANGYQQGKCPKCPSTDAFTEWGNGSKHCFSCGYHEGEKWDGLDITRNRMAFEKAKAVHLPSDYDTYTPNFALKWLQKYDITAKEIRENRIGYSADRSLLVFPVVDRSAALLMWQGRYFGDEPYPKWVTYGTRDDVMHFPKHHESDTIVLVEDIVSAIKVSRVTNCMPMFGSQLSQTMLLRVSKLFKKARVWGDPDATKKSMKTSFALTELGCPSTIIVTEKDPKEYGTADIRQIVATFED